jgi:hypothetical protein
LRAHAASRIGPAPAIPERHSALARGTSDVISRKDMAEWGSAGLVFISGGMAGHYASLGMNAAQWTGAAAAVLGSVTLAVAVRVWPAPVKAKANSKND